MWVLDPTSTVCRPCTRSGVLRIPIIALTVRGHEEIPNEEKAKDDGAQPPPRPEAEKAKVFQQRDTEGVFVVRDGIASFRAVKVGIAGDEYFEVLDGLRDGETIVAGTYQAIRDLKDGAKVKAAEKKEVRS